MNIAKGNIVELIHSDHLNSIIGIGTKGEVLEVYGDGSIYVKWSRGGTLSLLPKLGDAFKVIA